MKTRATFTYQTKDNKTAVIDVDNKFQDITFYIQGSNEKERCWYLNLNTIMNELKNLFEPLDSSIVLMDILNTADDEMKRNIMENAFYK